MNTFKIRWCLTLPAIWSVEQKDFMIRAVKLSGMTSSPDPIGTGELILVLEPEGAAANFIDYVPSIAVNPENQVVVVVDAGGGTVDLTAHQVKSGCLNELVAGHGNLLGGESVNRLFFEKLSEHFIGYNEWKEKKNPSLFYKTALEFEKKKCRLKEYNTVVLNVPSSLCKLPRKSNVPGEFEIEETEDEGGLITISKEKIKIFFCNFPR